MSCRLSRWGVCLTPRYIGVVRDADGAAESTFMTVPYGLARLVVAAASFRQARR